MHSAARWAGWEAARPTAVSFSFLFFPLQQTLLPHKEDQPSQSTLRIPEVQFNLVAAGGWWESATVLHVRSWKLTIILLDLCVFLSLYHVLFVFIGISDQTQALQFQGF